MRLSNSNENKTGKRRIKKKSRSKQVGGLQKERRKNQDALGSILVARKFTIKSLLDHLACGSFFVG